MNCVNVENELINIVDKDRVLINEPMSKHTTFRIGGIADFFIYVKSANEIKNVLKLAKDNNINVTVIGNGSNILVKDKGIRGIVIKNNIEKFEIDDDILTVGAGNKVMQVSRKAQQLSLSGLEFASGIPGTIGGAIRMNAGAYGSEFKDVVVETKCIDYEGNIFTFSNEMHQFGYRSSIFCNEKYIILETKLKLEKGNAEEIKNKMDSYMEKRKTSQPLDFPNAGSTFKRGTDFITAKIIDECGLKGKTIGEAMVSTKHAGFVVNKGNASARDVIELIEFIKKEVYNNTGKKIELELEIIGE